MPSKALLVLVAWLAGLSAAGVSWCAEETENQPEAQQVEVTVFLKTTGVTDDQKTSLNAALREFAVSV